SQRVDPPNDRDVACGDGDGVSGILIRDGVGENRVLIRVEVSAVGHRVGVCQFPSACQAVCKLIGDVDSPSAGYIPDPVPDQAVGGGSNQTQFPGADLPVEEVQHGNGVRAGQPVLLVHRCPSPSAKVCSLSGLYQRRLVGG